MPPRKQPETAFDRALMSVLNGGPPTARIRRAARSSQNGKEIVKVNRQPIQNIRDTILRIQQEADPIGFMIDVQEGAIFEEIVIQDVEEINEVTGEKHTVTVQRTEYVSPTLKQRLEAAKFLANKVLPTLTVQQIQVQDQRREEANDESAGYNPALKEPGQPTFAQIVHAAASKVAGNEIVQVPAKVVYIEPTSMDDDGSPVYPGSAASGEFD